MRILASGLFDTMDGWSATHARGATLGSRRRPLPLDMCGRLAAAAPCSTAAHMARRGRSRVAVTGRLGRRWVHPSVRGVLVENVQRRGVVSWAHIGISSGGASGRQRAMRPTRPTWCGIVLYVGRRVGDVLGQPSRNHNVDVGVGVGVGAGAGVGEGCRGHPLPQRQAGNLRRCDRGLGWAKHQHASTRLTTANPRAAGYITFVPPFVCCTNNHSPRSRPTRPPLVPPPPQIADQTMQFPRQRSVSRVMACFRPVLRARLAEHVTA